MSAFVCALVEWDWGWDADYNAEKPPLIKLSDKGKEKQSVPAWVWWHGNCYSMLVVCEDW